MLSSLLAQKFKCETIRKLLSGIITGLKERSIHKNSNLCKHILRGRLQWWRGLLNIDGSPTSNCQPQVLGEYIEVWCSKIIEPQRSSTRCHGNGMLMGSTLLNQFISVRCGGEQTLVLTYNMVNQGPAKT